MNEPDWTERFNRDLDHLLDGSFTPDQHDASDSYKQDLELARRLAATDLSASSRQRADLERHLTQLAETHRLGQSWWQPLRARLAGTASSLTWAAVSLLLVIILSWTLRNLLPGQPFSPASQLSTATSESVQTQPVIFPTPGSALTVPPSGQLPTPTSPVIVSQPEISAIPGKTSTYSDPVIGYAFDYPAGWFLQAEAGYIAEVKSFSPKDLLSERLATGQTELELISSHDLEANSLDDIAKQVREESRVFWEESWKLAGDIPAIRIQAQDDSGNWAALLTVINGRGLRMTGRGDLSQFDAIATTLRPVARLTVQPTDVPAEPPDKLLNKDSTSEEIRSRLEESFLLWDSLWVDARTLIPDNGKAKVQREQVWIKQPSTGLWLSGPEKGDPQVARIKSNGETVQLQMEMNARKELGNTSLVPTPLNKMILPAWSLALREGTFQAVGQGVVAGRQTVVVEYTNIEGQKADRFWMDAATGVILRWEKFSSGDGSNNFKEIQITSIVYDANFSDEMFDLDRLNPSIVFSNDAHLAPAGPDGSVQK